MVLVERHPDVTPPAQRPVHVAQVLPVHVLHGDEVAIVGFAQVEDLDDVGAHRPGCDDR